MNVTKKMPYSSEDLVKLYRDTDSGHWFDPGTLKYFKSRVTSNYVRVDDKNAFFITTEQNFNGTKRFATVRKATIVDRVDDDGAKRSKVEIDTHGEFNVLSLAQAKRILSKLKGGAS